MEDNKITNIEDKYRYLENLCGNSGIYADFRKFHHGDEDVDDEELNSFAHLWKFVKEVETKENGGISPDLDIDFELTDAEVMIIMYLKIFSNWMFENVKRRNRFWKRRRNRFNRFKRKHSK